VRDAEEELINAPRTVLRHLVIGGGPAGAMAATRLAESGCPVTLLERESGAHNKVCGEFLSGEAVQYLEQAGIEVRKLGAAAIDRVRVAAGARAVEAALPFGALSLSRKVLDEAMLERAAQSGCLVERGAEVVGMVRDGGLWRVDRRGRGVLWARHVFLATGKHDVRGWARGKGKQSDLVGFKMHWRLRPAQMEALRGVMELFLFPDGYGGLSLVEAETANLCFVIRSSRLRAIGDWMSVLEEIKGSNRRLRARLENAEPVYARPLAIAPIPYAHLQGARQGVWCLGDQAAVIPSFTGDGMSIALHSAMLATDMFLKGCSAEEFSRTLTSQLGAGMRLATLLSRTLVSPLGRHLIAACAPLVPAAIRSIAEATRISKRDLVPKGAERLGVAHPS
jgi:menaquinone-9 beta-reductase